MNGYERYTGMLSGAKVDCLPRIPILMHFAARHVGAAYADFAGDHRVMFEANKRLVLDYGFDQLDIMSDPYRETSAFGGAITYREDTIPLCLAPLADSKDLDLLARPDPRTSERLLNALRCIDAYQEFGHRKYSITGWIEGPAAEAATLRGVTKFLIDLAREPEFAAELMDVCVDVGMTYAEAQLKRGCDTIGVGDAICSQISPGMYEQLVLPREKRLVEAIHAAGGAARLHICGDTTHLLPLIGGAGFDIIDCDWEVDMKQARRHLGARTVLTGNLDPVNAVMRSEPKRIRERLKAIYAEVGNPYFVNAGCEIPAGTPTENLRALCEPIEAN